MSFLHPEFIFWMMPPVCILFYFLLTQKEVSMLYFDEGILEKLRVNKYAMSLRQRNFLYFFILTLLIIAMAQPVSKEKTVQVNPHYRDLLIALDLSLSMQANDVYPNRFEAAKQKIDVLLEHADQERVGIMGFGSSSSIIVPPTHDIEAIRFLLRQLKSDSAFQRGTDFKEMLKQAALLMKDRDEKILLILSDGGEQSSFDNIIAMARQNGIVVYILGIGTDDGGHLVLNSGKLRYNGNVVTSRLNPNFYTLATKSGGAYIQSQHNRHDIITLFNEIRAHKNVDTQQTKEVVLYIPLFIFPLSLALFLLLIAFSSISARQSIDVPASFLIGLLVIWPFAKANANFFDDEMLTNAKVAYQSGQYSRAARLYLRYAAQKDNDEEARYNAASAFYRQKAFTHSIALLQGIHSRDRMLQFNVMHNLGNAYVMLGNESNLKLAIESYENALRLNHDNETRYNLKKVKVALIKLVRKRIQLSKKNHQTGKGRQSRDHSKKEKTEMDSAQEILDNQSGASGSGKQNKHNTFETPIDTNALMRGSKVKNNTLDLNASPMSDREAKKWYQRLEKKRQTFIYRLSDGHSGSRNDSNKTW